MIALVITQSMFCGMLVVRISSIIALCECEIDKIGQSMLFLFQQGSNFSRASVFQRSVLSIRITGNAVGRFAVGSVVVGNVGIGGEILLDSRADKPLSSCAIL